MIAKLFNNFQPHNYQLNLKLDPGNMRFSGNVTITGTLPSATSTIQLHTKELKVVAAHVSDQPVAKHSLKKFDVLELQTTAELPAGEVKVTVEFTGTITDAMHGLYPCYFEHDGTQKKLLATQFESHHAREVFPCIDEPAAKATFDLTLTTPQNETVLSNMPLRKQTTKDGQLISHFETTPQMSTYLLAFVCGEMISKESTTKDGVIIRSWASAAQDPDWLDYSLKETAALIEFYNDYFGVPYPLPKCDQVALPDFEVGAMENWGLITYRETVFLSDPKNISLSTQQWVSLVIAHELSHQWFGNLVTMQWWDDLWLNESFANMTEYLAVDRLHPEWNIWEEFTAQDALSATNRDVYSDVQSVRVTVNDPQEVSTLFDPSIVYAKGGKLLKMLHDLLGDDVWRAGLKDYFEVNAYKNTDRDDLWQALSKHTELDIAALMNTWIEQPGQPLINAQQSARKLKLSQKRLLLDAHSDDTIWQIPLLSPDLPLTLDLGSKKLELSSDNWVRLNRSGIGHYIVNYQNSQHKQWLAAELANPHTETTWKIARLNELIMLAKHGDTNLAEALEAVQHSQQEQRAMVWSLIAGVLANARMLTEGSNEAERILKQLSAHLAKPNFQKLGWEYQIDEDSNQTHLRTFMLSLMAASEDHAVISHALKLYRSTPMPELLPAESRSLILALVAKFGTEAEFHSLIKQYKASQNAEYKVDICAGLTTTKNSAYVKELLELMLDTKVVRSQDLRHWFVYLLRNRYGRDLTWQWLRDNWSWIEKHFGGSKSYDDYARYSASFFSTAQKLKEYTEFFKDKQTDPVLKRAIAIGIEEIKARVAWRDRDEAKILQWLTEYSTKSS